VIDPQSQLPGMHTAPPALGSLQLKPSRALPRRLVLAVAAGALTASLYPVGRVRGWSLLVWASSAVDDIRLDIRQCGRGSLVLHTTNFELARKEVVLVRERFPDLKIRWARQ
jgi:hypothetical protein